MRTTLATEVTVTSTIPGIQAHAHDLPGFPNITCIDFVNGGNKDIPPALKHVMLVPEGTSAPDLGLDRTLYSVPSDYASIAVTIALGIVDDKDFLVAQMSVRTEGGETSSLTHVPCELL
jgi:hypothetical protein